MSEIQAQTKDWLICHECGELQTIVALSPEHELICYNCGNSLHSGHGQWLNLASALAATALVLFVITNYFPFLTLEIGSQSHSTTILDGFAALMERNQWVLAGLIITTIFLFPLFEIFAFLYLLIPYSMNRRLPGQAWVLRWLVIAQAWSMLEVFMLSLLVTSVKLADMSVIRFEVGAYAFALLVGVLILAFLKVDRRKLWSWINTNNYFTSVDGEEVYDCRVCSAMVGKSLAQAGGHCPRCHSPVHRRIPHSMQKTTALVIAAAILYIPANVLPIMTYATLGDVSTDTIYSGVVALMAAGLWGIGLVVFIASIAVPMTKLFILIYLLWAVHAKIKVGVKHRAMLYRFTEFIGRWSMVDVFVVTILVALVQFGFVYTVEPEGAIIAFAAVVVLTMIAAETFDPRLLWDALDEAPEPSSGSLSLDRPVGNESRQRDKSPFGKSP